MKWLQELQNAYASLCNMTILTVDVNGYPITEPSGVNPFTKLIIEDQNLPLQDWIRTVLDNLHQIAKTIFYDHIRPDINPSLPRYEPVKKTVFVIVVGVIIEEAIRLEYMDTHSAAPEVWKEALGYLPETSLETKQ